MNNNIFWLDNFAVLFEKLTIVDCLNVAADDVTLVVVVVVLVDVVDVVPINLHVKLKIYTPAGLEQ